MQARAAVMPARHGRWTIEALDVAEPGPHEILVRVVASGICQTDVHARDGFFPIPCPAVYGHEGAGIVERVGSAVATLRAGDHVLLASPYCGACPECLAGFQTYCEQAPALKFGGFREAGQSIAFRRGLDAVYGSFFQQSSFAGLTLASARSAVRVPVDLPLDILAALPCGVNTGAGAVLHVMKPQPGDSYVAFGVGAVGCAGVMAARLAGCSTVIAVDVFPERLEVARTLGATHVLDARDPDLVGQVRRIAGGRGARWCLEAAGVPGALRAAVDVLAPRGTACLVGNAREGVEVNLDMAALMQGRVVRGCVQGDSDVQSFLPELIELYRAGRLPVERFVRYYPLEAINDAVADMLEGRTIKAVLTMEG